MEHLSWRMYFVIIGLFLGCLELSAGSSSGFHPGKNLLDMSYDYAADTLVWPTAQKFKIQKRYEGPNEHGIWVASEEFCSPEHGGTHMDAPYHFAKGKWTVDQIPPDHLIATGVVVDISKKAKENPDAQLTAEDLVAWEKTYGPIPASSVVIMYSNWGQYWGNESTYFGNDEGIPSKFHFPGFHPEAARWLVTNRHIVGVGVDTASVDYGATKDSASHRIFGEENIYVLENVAHVDKLPPLGARLIVLPMKIRSGTGGPCRILAEITYETNSAGRFDLSFFKYFLAIFVAIISNVLNTHI